VGDLVHPYLNRRTGREDIEYIHPGLRTHSETDFRGPSFSGTSPSHGYGDRWLLRCRS
jgi:hypothetical protein